MTKKQLYRLRSEAAKKGWRTRRTNDRKRSEAAKKGWRTRRTNDRKREQVNKKKAVAKGTKELIASGDYGTASSTLRLQIHIEAPSDATNEEILEQVSKWKAKEDLDKGYKITLVTWQHADRSGSSRDIEKSWQAFSAIPDLDWSIDQ